MNRKIPPPVLFLILLGFIALEGLSWGGEEQTITLGGKPLTLMGEKAQVGKTLPPVSYTHLTLPTNREV